MTRQLAHASEGAKDHHHDWRPLPKWSGRYRCPGCASFGYRKLVVGRIRRGRNDAIIPYRCGVPKCPNNAIGRVSRGGRWFCAAHRPPGEEQSDAE